MSVVVTTLGQVDPTLYVLQNPGAPKDLSLWAVRMVIQSADYSTGVLLTNVATAIGASAILEAIVTRVAVTAGTTQLGFGVHDVANNKVRFLVAITNQTTATDYTAVNGDIWDLLVVGA